MTNRDVRWVYDKNKDPCASWRACTLKALPSFLVRYVLASDRWRPCLVKTARCLYNSLYVLDRRLSFI